MSTIKSDSKPFSVAPIFESIPRELTLRPGWVVWRWEQRPDRAGRSKWTKPPYNARTAKAASTTAPETWSTYQDAMAAFQNGGWDGIGVVLTPRLSGVDLDHVVDPVTKDS